MKNVFIPDHIAMDETSNKASIALDVMPLINGHLPIPQVKISKYFPPSKGKKTIHFDAFWYLFMKSG